MAAVTQAAEDNGYPNILIDPNGQKGILQNLIEFNTYAFAIVKNAEGISMTRVPTTATPELIQLIGTEVKLMTKEKQQLAEKERRAKEDSRSRANIR